MNSSSSRYPSPIAVGALLMLLNALPSTAAPFKTATASLEMEGRHVMAWYPVGVEQAVPLVLFSHGFGGVNVQSMTLMRSLAGAGYLVLAPNHRDSARWLGGEGKSAFQASFGVPDSWDASTYKDRQQDLLAVYRGIAKQPKIASLYRGGPVILAGHSLGGYTALGMAGARPGWETEISVAGVIALSPYVAPYVRNGGLARLKAPVMYQGGTLDSGITPVVSRSGGAYDLTPTAKVFVLFEGAGHTSWTELRPELQPQIAKYAIAFCDRFAKNKSKDPLGEKLAAVAELRTSGL